MSHEAVLTTNGGEYLDECFAKGVDIHIERMDKNEIMVSLHREGKSMHLFIGHWPRNRRKNGTLLVNVTENDLGVEWSRP